MSHIGRLGHRLSENSYHSYHTVWYVCRLIPQDNKLAAEVSPVCLGGMLTARPIIGDQSITPQSTTTRLNGTVQFSGRHVDGSQSLLLVACPNPPVRFRGNSEQALSKRSPAIGGNMASRQKSRRLLQVPVWSHQLCIHRAFRRSPMFGV